jgi:hypothetical protein
MPKVPEYMLSEVVLLDEMAIFSDEGTEVSDE